MSFDFVFPNYKHQQLEFDLHKDDKARALIWQMRTGKTKAMVDLACYLWKQCEIDAVIVIAPNNVHTNWHRRELPKHHWRSVPYRSFVWEASKTVNVNYDLAFESHCKETKKLKWYMVNAEALANIKGRDYLAYFVKSCWQFLLIVDEVHEFRWATSKRSKALRGLASKASYKRILSANPTDNSPLHAFAEYEILEPGALGFSNYTAFETRYSVKEIIYIPDKRAAARGIKRAPKKKLTVTGYKNQDELRARIAKWSSLVLRDEVDELPALIRGQVEFDLNPNQKKIYNDLVLGTLARLDRGDIIPPSEGGVLLIRLQQITSGYIINDEGNIVDLCEENENPRIKALLSAVKEAAGKFIVWCRFREDVQRVTKALNGQAYGALDYYGGTSKRRRVSNEEAFREDPRCRAMVGQYQAGGQGLDFSAATDIFWYSHTTDLLRRRQADERATKIGGRKIGVTDIIALGSNDSKMLKNLQERETVADFLTGSGLREYLTLIR